MATRSFNEKVVIRDAKTFERLVSALEKPSKFDHIKPITDQEAERRAQLGMELLQKKWSSSQ